MTIFKNKNLKPINYYNLEVFCRFYTEGDSKDKVFRILEVILKEKPEKILVIGEGSNILFSKKYFDGFVLRIFNDKNKNNDIKIKKGRVEVFGGEVLENVINRCFSENLQGLEWAGGLPGTIGAGVRGNVGAFGKEIKDVVEKVEVVYINGGGGIELKKLSKKDLKFSYRTSIIKENGGIVLTSTLRLKKVSNKQIKKAKEIYKNNIKYRTEKHPLEYPNCGSVFKNITNKKNIKKILEKWPDLENFYKEKWHGKIPMGVIIERLSLKGKKIGGAKISEKHANFIINTGNAKPQDILDLIEIIKEKTNKELGFIPEPEITIV